MCGFLNDNLGIDFGYRFCKKTWGRGIGTEAAEAVMKYGLTDLAMNSIVAGVLPENIASEKILIKLGFSYQDKICFMGKMCKIYLISRQHHARRTISTDVDHRFAGGG